MPTKLYVFPIYINYQTLLSPRLNTLITHGTLYLFLPKSRGALTNKMNAAIIYEDYKLF